MKLKGVPATRRVLSSLLLSAVLAASASADIITWTGGTTGTNRTWASTSSWTAALGSGNDLYFGTGTLGGGASTLTVGTAYMALSASNTATYAITVASLNFDNTLGQFENGALSIRNSSALTPFDSTVTMNTAGNTAFSVKGGGNAAAVTFGSRLSTASLVFNLNYTGSSDFFVDTGATLSFAATTSQPAMLTGTGGINKTGAGTMVVSGASNNFTGGLTISGGVLSTSSSLYLGSSTAANAVVINGGTLRFTNSSSITNTSTRGIQVGANVGTIDVSNAAFRIGTTNTIGNYGSDAGVLRKIGTGILSIENGTNTTHTGGTQLNEGTIVLALNSTLGGASGLGLTASSGTTFRGSGTVNGNSSFATGSNIEVVLMGGSATVTNAIGTLTFNGNLALGDVNLLFDLDAIGASDKIALASGKILSIGSGVIDLTNFSFTALSGITSGTYTLVSTDQAISGSLGSVLTGNVNGNEVTLLLGNGGTTIDLLVFASAIPEPSTYAALAGFAGLIGAIVVRRRSKKSVA